MGAKSSFESSVLDDILVLLDTAEVVDRWRRFPESAQRFFVFTFLALAGLWTLSLLGVAVDYAILLEYWLWPYGMDEEGLGMFQWGLGYWLSLGWILALAGCFWIADAAGEMSWQCPYSWMSDRMGIKRHLCETWSEVPLRAIETHSDRHNPADIDDLATRPMPREPKCGTLSLFGLYPAGS